MFLRPFSRVRARAKEFSSEGLVGSGRYRVVSEVIFLDHTGVL